MFEDLKKKGERIYIHGAVPEGDPWLFYHGLDANEKVLVVLGDDRTAKRYHEAYERLAPGRSSVLVGETIVVEDIAPVDGETDSSFFRAIQKTRRGGILFAPISALLIPRLAPPEAFLEEKTYRADDALDPDAFVAVLEGFGYRRTETVEREGEYARRGGIVDFYAPGEEPVRVEFFGDEIDSVRVFDPSDQRSSERIDAFSVTQAGFRITPAIVDAAQAKYEHDGGEDTRMLLRFEHWRSVPPMNELLIAPFLPRHLLTDYFDRIIVRDDLPHEKLLGESYKHAMEDVTYGLERGLLIEEQKDMLLPPETVKKGLWDADYLAMLLRTGISEVDRLVKITSVEAEHFRGDVTATKQSIARLSEEGYAIDLFTANRARADRLKIELAGISNVRVYETDAPNGALFPEERHAFFGPLELFGAKTRTQKKKRGELLRLDLLTPGDFVVHETHGIGRFEKITTIEKEGVKRDYLMIRYAGSDRLYIPTDQLGILEKYMGTGEHEPKLTKLSTPEWSRTKARAKKALDKIADDLVELYAKRSAIEGFAFLEDDDVQRTFESRFDYEDTPSQAIATREIKADMEKSSPMDRLLLGDVGYGKTEVAFRAAMKAILSGKQAALLVPTTILAMQHYETATKRFEEEGATVRVLSRFISTAEQKKTLEDVRLGKVDLLIGTHKLFSKDVRFYDLGLLIVDEEQRFGVRHKEAIKARYPAVDVLTLSATPIPRTLQMGLVGIRDLSTLNEPPTERIPTTTYVTEWSESLVRHAILREIDRGGQVYYVHNTVLDMEHEATKIQKIVPEARIAIAHGQMTERALEKVMEDFTDKKIDVLITSTIIETGMDIANVNTMIVSHADRFGLSSLYQLKGRIGRSDRPSYAYFTYPEGKVLTEIAQKRLVAIRDFSSFGSGFKIAMRDLELRGAGNLLGESQSGHIEAIGYGLFVRFLEEALAKKKGEYEERNEETLMDFAVDAHLPRSYVADEDERLFFYKRIAEAEDEATLDELYDELVDRFSDMPKSAYELIRIAKLKLFTRTLPIARIREENGEVLFVLTTREIEPGLIRVFSDTYGRRMRMKMGKTLKIYLTVENDAIAEAGEFLALFKKQKHGIIDGKR